MSTGADRGHYGWVIAGSAMFALLVTNGLVIGGINAFDPALLEEFDWDRGTLKLRDLLTFAIAGLLGPFAGALADRLGVRRLMAFGALLLSASLAVYSRIDSPTDMYLIHVLFAGVLVTCGLIVNVMLVSAWFTARRGTAIGLALVGTSLGGMFFPPLATRLIDAYGWRNAFLIEAAVPILLFAAILALVKSRPSEKGLEPYGGAPKASVLGGDPDGMSFGDAIRTRTFWALAFAAMTTFYCILGAQAHLILHLTDQGFSRATAASGLTVLFGMALIGKFVFGLLVDHLKPKRVLLGNIAVMLVGAVLLASIHESALWPAVILFGIGWGGLYTLLQLLTVESFGLKASGKILGTITVLDAIGGGLGIWLTGLLYDRTGSYEVPFTVLAVLIFLALLAATQVRTSRVEGS